MSTLTLEYCFEKPITSLSCVPYRVAGTFVRLRTPKAPAYAKLNDNETRGSVLLPTLTICRNEDRKISNMPGTGL